MIQHATKSLKQARHKGRMNARRSAYNSMLLIRQGVDREADIIYPNRADAVYMRQLNRKHRRQLGSTRYRTMMKKFLAA
ncbi:hypothetical protein [Rhizobium phage RHph_I40]|uniref:Uncharacterized protein n=1 Tax=Rhizobium phage RHph_I38 TaxID=2509734 RepID=A0A7S5R8Z2_9CAUD|nr:hypothetical protein EVC01_004 [Rhizobium phage RHph_I38]QXV73633.1 hypothetical protein [Rhizobium phage RHph_I40]